MRCNRYRYGYSTLPTASTSFLRTIQNKITANVGYGVSMSREARDLAASITCNSKTGGGGELLLQSSGRRHDAEKSLPATTFDKEVADASRRRVANAKREKALALRQGRTVSQSPRPEERACTTADCGVVFLQGLAGSEYIRGSTRTDKERRRNITFCGTTCVGSSAKDSVLSLLSLGVIVVMLPSTVQSYGTCLQY